MTRKFVPLMQIRTETAITGDCPAPQSSLGESVRRALDIIVFNPMRYAWRIAFAKNAGEHAGSKKYLPSSLREAWSASRELPIPVVYTTGDGSFWLAGNAGYEFSTEVCGAGMRNIWCEIREGGKADAVAESIRLAMEKHSRVSTSARAPLNEWALDQAHEHPALAALSQAKLAAKIGVSADAVRKFRDMLKPEDDDGEHEEDVEFAGYVSQVASLLKQKILRGLDEAVDLLEQAGLPFPRARAIALEAMGGTA